MLPACPYLSLQGARAGPMLSQAMVPMTWGLHKGCSRGLGKAGLLEAVGNRTRKV